MFFKFCSNFKNIKYYKHSIKLKMASGVPHCHLWDVYIHIYLPTHVTLSIYVCVFAHACSFTQLCLTLCCPMDCIWLDSSVHGIFQAIIEEWVATASSRDSSWPRDWTHISYIGRWILYHWVTWEAPFRLGYLEAKSVMGILVEMLYGGDTLSGGGARQLVEKTEPAHQQHPVPTPPF